MDVPASKSLTTSIRDFFYTEETPYGLAVIRICLPLILLFVVIPRWIHARELFSTDGAAAPLALNYGVLNFPPEPSGLLAVVMMTALVFSLIAACLGWHTRIALILTWVLYTWLNMLDCLSTFTKYSVISSHILLLLSLSSCGSIWSIDAWRNRTAEQSPPPQSAAWPRRLMQLLIGLIYFGAAFTKMHTDGFMSGDQIRYWLLTNVNNANPLGEALAMFPELIVAMSHIAVVWQIVFVFLSWRGPARILILGMGSMFHLSTVWLLGLHIFPPIMILSYAAWLNADDVQRIRHWLQTPVAHRLTAPISGAAASIRSMATRGRQLLPIPSAMLFAVILTGSVLGGIELEHWLDPYGKRRDGGPYTLQPMSADRVALMFEQNEQIREADKFFALEIGSETLGGVVINRGTTWQPGDSIIAQCVLVPPHDDLWISCVLTDSLGQELYQAQLPIYREMRRADFPFTFTSDMAPGDYRLVIRSAGETVLSRTIHLVADDGSVLSN